MKKVLNITGIILGVLILMMILLPILFKAQIEQAVKEKINEQVNATVDWDRVSLSFFRGFPELSVGLHDLLVTGKAPFEGDSLLGFDRFELRLKPFSLLKNELEVSAVILNKPRISALMLENGAANWDIAMPADTVPVKEETEKEGGGRTLSLKLERFAIQDGAVLYIDLGSETFAYLEGLDLELGGDFSMAETVVDLRLDIAELGVESGGITYMRKGVFHLALEAAADLESGRYTLKENLISLNGLALGAEGEVRMDPLDGILLDLDYYTRETSFKTLLSLVPAVYLEGFEELKADGRLELQGEVNGQLKDSILPDVSLELRVSDARFSYPDLPGSVEDIQLELNAHYVGADMDQSVLDLKRLHFQLENNPFDINLRAAHPLSDPHVTGRIDGKIDFSELRNALPLDDLQLQGQMEAALEWDTRLSLIEAGRYEDVDLKGRLGLEGVTVETDELPVPLIMDNLQLNFSPRAVDLSQARIRLGSSDLSVNGELRSFLPYVFSGETLEGRLEVRSRLLDLNELMSDEELSDLEEEVSTDSLQAPAPDSLAIPAEFVIPENLDLILELDLKRILMKDMEIRDLQGRARIVDATARLDGLSMRIAEGRIRATGLVDTRGAFTAADLDLDLEDIDIPSAYEQFVSIEKLLPLARQAEGRATVALELSTLLDRNFSPLYESINARGSFLASGLRVRQSEGLEQLAAVLNNEKFSSLEASDLKASFIIRDGRVRVRPFDVKFSDSKIRVRGSHGVDLSLDYKLDMDIARSDLGTSAAALLSQASALTGGLVDLDDMESFRIKATVGGSFNRPELRLGSPVAVQGQVREQVKAKVEEEVKKVVEEKKDEALAKAELEAERILEEARKQSERLIAEADRQGKKLIEEAGSNPLKALGARTAAEELNKQARKQSDKILKDAQAKADSILQKAREY